MDKIIPGKWAQALCNGEFLCIETWSGYRGGDRRDPKGRQIFLSPDASDEELSIAVKAALAHSRFVLGAPRTDVWIHPEVEFDMELYDYKLNIERYANWVKYLMEHYAYKTKQALFKNMENCHIAVYEGVVKITPMRHVKLDAWEGLGPNDMGSIEIPVNCAPAEIGAALRLAFSRCTG